MPIILKNRYDERRLAGMCARCPQPAEATRPYCAACREHNRLRFARQRATPAGRATYNAYMRAWKAEQRAC